MIAGASGAVVLWVFAAKAGFDILRASRARGAAVAPSAWAWLVAFPFAARGFDGAPADEAVRLNKMLVGFFAAILIAAGSAAVYSNLTFVPPPAQTIQ
ncbi:hypothetical protein [Ancylobacter terrae]|uniref:hypothetical protein n=1 Tax=Ancylobacter sp. sgz301288 TaxID=3342077 RepID=UPI00386E6781